MFMTPVLVCMIACGKEGPAGPQGPVGPQGVQGPAGLPGATVKGYGPFLVDSLDWTTIDTLSWRTVITLTNVTQEIADKGLVQVFMKLNATWWAMPYSEGDEFFVYGVEPGKVIISAGHSHFTYLPHPGDFTFRVVLGASSAAMARRSDPMLAARSLPGSLVE